MRKLLPWNPSLDDVVWRTSSPIAPSAIAVFSHDCRHRYVLTRTWDEQKPQLAIIGLNPSTATEVDDDPTIRRCVDFAARYSYGGIIMLNLFAWRATDPRELKRTTDPIGRLNDEAISAIAGSCDVLCAWGVHGANYGRAARVLQLLRDLNARLLCLGTTKDGAPKHPLYLKATTPLVAFEARANA